MRILFLFLLFLCACSSDVPKGVMPPSKMEGVLYDVLRADEWVDFASLGDSTFHRISKRTALYDSVFRLNGITKDEYRKSMNFYQSRPDLFKEILQSLRAKSDTALKKMAAADSLKVKP